MGISQGEGIVRSWKRQQPPEVKSIGTFKNATYQYALRTTNYLQANAISSDTILKYF